MPTSESSDGPLPSVSAAIPPSRASGVASAISSAVPAAIAPGKMEPASENLVRIAASCVIAAAVVATLYLARPVLLPFALATLLAFALAPVVSVLHRWGLNRGSAVICTVAFALAIFACLAMFIGNQLSHLAPGVPRYQANLLVKIESIRSSATRSTLFKSATGVFNNFDNAISGTTPGVAPAGAGPVAGAAPAQPVTVEIRKPNPGPLEILENVADPLLQPLAGVGLVVIFVIFILLQKEDLRDRFISLAGARDLQRTTSAIDEGAQRLSRYLLMQMAVNTCFGVFIAAGLWVIGIPSPALWGLIAGIARFIPYVGLPVAAVLPLTLALAIDPGWAMVAASAILIFGAEAVTGQAIEPWLYGRQMGLSSIAVVLCAVFWTWIWGPVGLFLATPLTMCMAIIGRNVEHLKFLDILLGDRAALMPEEAFYLSMLAGKPDEEAARAETMLKDASLCDYLDTVAIKGLALAHLDEGRGALDAIGGEKIHMAVRQLLEDISDLGTVTEAENAPAGNAAQRFDSFAGSDAVPVLCVAGRGELDSAAATLLGAVLHRRGIASRAITSEMTTSTRLGALDAAGTRVICLSYLAPCNHKNARYLVRRIRKQLPGALIVTGFWNEDHNDTTFLDAIETTSSDGIVTTLGEAAAQIGAMLKAEAAGAAKPPAVGADLREPQRAGT
jgi:predicted PurR-regulated permease PerM